MWPVRSNEKFSAAFVTKHLGNLLFLDEHSADLVVVFDEPPFIAADFRTSKSSLQCIENILEAIVDVMDGDTLSPAQVEQNHDLKRIVVFVFNSSGSR